MLALALGKTVTELQATMPQAEFMSWVQFYRLFPFDDFHRFHRPAAMVGASMGGDIKSKLEWLSPEPVPEGYSQAELNSFKAFGITPPPRK